MFSNSNTFFIVMAIALQLLILLGRKTNVHFFLAFIAHWSLCTKSSEPPFMYIQALKMHPTYNNPYQVSQGLFKQYLFGFSLPLLLFPLH